MLSYKKGGSTFILELQSWKRQLTREENTFSSNFLFKDRVISIFKLKMDGINQLEMDIEVLFATLTFHVFTKTTFKKIPKRKHQPLQAKFQSHEIIDLKSSWKFHAQDRNIG